MIAPLPPTGLEVEETTHDGEYTLALSGELDIASVPSLEAAVTRRCAEPQTSAVTLDLGRLQFIDSTGLAAIVLASKLCEEHGHEFALIPGPSSVQRLFELTGLIDVLPFREAENCGSDSKGDALPA